MTRRPAGFILVGGASRRMGRDKALLPVGGRPLAAWVALSLQDACSDVFLVGAPDRPYPELGLPFIPDPWPGSGPLAGIAAGLEHLAGAQQEWGVFTACDLPLVKPQLLGCLAEDAARAGADAAVPVAAGRPQVLCAVYRTTLLPHARRLLAGGGGPVRSLLEAPGARVLWLEEDWARRWDPDLRSFFNLNTPLDLERVRPLLEQPQGRSRKRSPGR